MDDQTLIQRAAPAGWQVEPYGTPGVWVLSPGKFQGFVTVDMKRRAFALGFWLIGISLDWSSWKTYAGLVALTAAMVLANR